MYSKLGRKLSNEEFDFRIKDSNFRRINDYINSNTVILFECKICGKKFRKKPKGFNKLACKCEKHKNNYLNFIKHKNIEIIDPYVSMRIKIKHKCLKCELIFKSSPKTVKNSVVGCPSCSGKIFSIEKYRSLLTKGIILESEIYNGCDKKLRHKCLNCGNSWETKPNYIIHMGCGCPKCSLSKGEKEISNLLDELGIKYQQQYTVDINNKKYRFDFFVPLFNLLIEYDGIQHFKPVEYFGGKENFETVKLNDSIKNDWVNEKGYNILRIGYVEDIKISIYTYFENLEYYKNEII